MKIVFFGTPAFALKPLKKLLNSKHKVVAVISQPDRARDRKGNLIATPVKALALENNLVVYQFDSVKMEGVDILKSLNADIFITAAYGQILSQEILDLPEYGVLNIHASLLPKYRGASPVQCAIMAGEKETGVTIMQTDIGLDTGDIILAQKINIDIEDTTLTLSDKLSEAGAELVLKALDLIERGNIKKIKQDNRYATKCPLLSKEMGRIDWNDSAINIYNKIRAVDCFTFLGELRLKIIKAEVLSGNSTNKTGSISDDFVVECGKDRLIITELLPQNKKRMSREEFMLGYDIKNKNLN